MKKIKLVALPCLCADVVCTHFRTAFFDLLIDLRKQHDFNLVDFN